MPKNRKKTFSDLQSEASRANKLKKQNAKNAPREDPSQAAARNAKAAAENK